MDSMQTKTSAQTSGSFPASGGFPHPCWVISLAAGAVLLSVALLSTGCFKEQSEGMEMERMKISVNALFPGESSAKASTKAVVDGTQALTLNFARADENSSGIYGAYGTEFAGTRAAGAGSTPLTFDPVQYYPKGGLKTRIAGWYPGGATKAGSGNGYYDAAAGTVSWTIDGTQDIIAASVQEGSTTVAMPGFTFTRQLAQIQVWPYAESEAAAIHWGPIEKIILSSQPDRCILTLPQGGGTDAVFSAGGSTGLSVRNIPSSNLSTTASIHGDPVMIFPRTSVAALNITIVTTSGIVLDVTVPERTYPAGSVTAVKLRFTPIEVQVDPTVTLSDWADGGELNNYPKVIDGNTITLFGQLGAADPALYPSHEPWTKTPEHIEHEWDANDSGFNTCGKTFKVASQDAIGKDGSSGRMTWYEAVGKTHSTYNPEGYSACREYYEETDQSDKGQWRLPTVRELRLVCDKKSMLTAANMPFSNGGYTTATMKQTDFLAWYVIINGGNTNYEQLERVKSVRCVRDL